MNSLPLFRESKQMLLDDIAKAMQSIGYKNNLLVKNWEYNDVINNKGQDNKTGIIDLAGYARTPQDYRNACIAVATSDNGDANANLAAKHRSIGAPLFFAINATNISRWKVTEKGKPELKEIIQPNEIFSAFERNAEVWKPERIFRAKIEGEFEGATQLDFFDIGLLPLLEGMIHKRLDRLLKEVLAKMTNVYEENNVKPNYQEYQEIYRIIFRFIVAKVMKDRKHPISPQNDALVILKAIEYYYNPPRNVTIDSPLKEQIIEVAWQEISNGFQFQNLSVDDLAFVYESSLVTPETRKIFGTHSTPPRVAEYVIRKLPIKELIPIEDRYCFEPCAGHAGFLIAAMRRLKELLPENESDDYKHKYLVDRLTAFEIESFALEASWSRLVLADYPHPNGWRLLEGDVFTDARLDEELKKTRILLCNPPYESFNHKEREHYQGLGFLPKKPAEILKRFLQNPPELMGLILPSSFNTASIYSQFHKQIAETYEKVELIALPEVFKYSEATTTLVLASYKRNFYGNIFAVSRKVSKGQELDDFIYGGKEPKGSERVFEPQEYLKSSFTLWTSPFIRVWDYLQSNPKLGDIITKIHTGIRWQKTDDEVKKKRKLRKEISYEEKEGYKKGYPKVAGHFKQFSLQNPCFLSVKREDQIRQVYEFIDWDKPKVIANEIRLGRKGWRLGAIADTEGFIFTRSFFHIGVKDNISVFAVSAILNSPIANAFMFAMEDGKYNHARVMKKIPIPPKSSLTIAGKIDELAQRLQNEVKTQQFVEAKETLLILDAEILRLYDLPPQLEKEILSIFQDVKRPVPFGFNGYYPKDFFAYLPLYEIISPEFKEAQNTSLFDRVTIINDEEISEAMAYIRGELSDENISS